MHLRNLYSIILATAIVIAAASCDKDKDNEVSPSLNGALRFSVPEYVSPKQVVTLVPKGISHPDDAGIGYYWKVSPSMEKSDTTRLENGLSPDGKESDGSFTYQFPDSLGTYTISCYGFAEGYTSSYKSSYTTVVKGGLDGSIQGTGILSTDTKITAEGVAYYYTTHNGLDWMRNNLANPEFGTAYSNAEAMSNVFGRFYNYEEAMKACPEGWRLPTDAEWVALANSVNPESNSKAGEPLMDVAADLMADISFNGTKMWEYWPTVGEITNRSGLAALPAGYANLGEKDEDGKYPAATFFGINEYSAFWTSDKVDGSENMAYYRYIICDQPDIPVGKGDIRTFGANVRCVREVE